MIMYLFIAYYDHLNDACGNGKLIL